ncbi:MAG: hypothetical protein JRN26_01805 [Nitrososphaerota archaeon]|jgi:hypothetical protein|nr:hypothetical protein [Nitrososphaerota archaeon]MDG6931788.1 hypothetical protein [Nitrososphaerota archaeon]MDG6935612.1 hypothetical protein [Nitrososphaerota archaeon]MDG6944889.1 hypothetical protein [Nitrososphaerota archaeon]
METYVYELKPVNFFNLVHEEQQATLGSFVSLLNNLGSLASFHIKGDVSEVKVLDSVIRQPYKRYFVESKENLDGVLASSGFRFVKVLEVPQLKVRGAVRNFMVLENGRLARVFNVYSLPSKLPVGFLMRYYDFADEIRLDVRPVLEGERLVEQKYRSVSAKLDNMKQVDARSQIYLSALDNARLSVASGVEKLFEMRLTATVVANGYEELRNKSLSLLKFMEYAEAPSRIQPAVYHLSGPMWATGRWFYITSSSLAPFFPFAGMDLVDPEGAFVGRNLQTGNSVIFDVFERDNYNISVLGQTGYGKSMFIKSYISRIAQRDDKSMMYVFDSIVKPEYAVGSDGTYETSIAKEIGAEVLRFNNEEQFGFDPLLIFSKRDAGEFIRELVKLDEGSEDTIELFSLVKEANNITELIAKADGNLKRRLETELEPTLRFFTGKTGIYDRMVFVLSDIQSSFVRDALAFLILGAVWNTVKEQPVSLRKFLVIDEGWAFVETNPRTGKPYFPMAIEYIPEIARTGRHYSMAFLIASQLVSDFVGSSGKVVLESSATKIILRQDSASMKLLKDTLNLSDDESKMTLSARPGQGILITPDGHVPFFNVLLPEELKKFSTKAV